MLPFRAPGSVVRSVASVLSRSVPKTQAASLRVPAALINRTPASALVPTVQKVAAVAPLQHSAAVRFLSTPAPAVYAKPTQAEAKTIPRDWTEMSNEVLMIYAAHGIHEAHREVLIREIMSVDSVEWDVANAKLDEMEEFNKSGMRIFTMPFYTGITVAVTGGLLSIPLCFHLDTVMWFNDNFVTADVAEPKDLETWLEVGSWAWNWMEPPLGQISFFLLALQFARNQMVNLKLTPYTDRVTLYRAQRLVDKYPQYSSLMVSEFAKSADWH